MFWKVLGAMAVQRPEFVDKVKKVKSTMCDPRVCSRTLAGIPGSNPVGGFGSLCLVIVVCCQVRGLCDGLITPPEEPYRLWCVMVCHLETSGMRRPWPALGLLHQKKKSPPPASLSIMPRSVGKRTYGFASYPWHYM
jgi:hypothetical protein